MGERTKASQFRKEMKLLYGKNIHIRGVQDAYNTQRKPYDTYMFLDKEFYAIEFKLVRGLSVRGDLLKSHQVEGLLEVDRLSKARGYVIVFLEHKEWKNKALVFDICEWIEHFDGRSNGDGVWEFLESSKKIVDLIAYNGDNLMIRKKETLDDGSTKTIWEGI